CYSYFSSSSLDASSVHHSFPTRRSSDLLRLIYGSIERLGLIVLQDSFQDRQTPKRFNIAIGLGFFKKTKFFIALVQHRNDFCQLDRKSTRLNSSHLGISYAVFCLKKQNN